MDASEDKSDAGHDRGGDEVKRSVMIGGITVMAELGIWTIACAAGTLIGVDSLKTMIAAAVVAAMASPVVWLALDENMAGRKK